MPGSVQAAGPCGKPHASKPALFFQENPVTGRKADVIRAAHLCAEAALRLVKPGNQVSEAVEAELQPSHLSCHPVRVGVSM